jgi:hypothetical protein
MNKNKNKNQMFKKIRTMIKAKALEAPHPTLVTFGISVAIVIGLMIGLGALSDGSHMAHAMKIIGK